jgi:hypothetical protein
MKMKYPYDFNDDGELSAYEYALFMDEMERDDREINRSRSLSSMYNDDYDEGSSDSDDNELDDDFGEDELDEEDWDI